MTISFFLRRNITMLMKKENINPICSGQKWITLRKSDFKIIPGKDHKLMNNFGKPYFAEVFIEYTFMYDIRCMTDEFAYMLGFDSVEDYMAQGYNANEGFMRKAIVWSNVRVNKKFFE